MLMTKRAVKARRARMNAQIVKHPQWVNAFTMYDIQIGLAERAGDKTAVRYLQALRTDLICAIREDWEARGIGDA